MEGETGKSNFLSTDIVVCRERSFETVCIYSLRKSSSSSSNHRLESDHTLRQILSKSTLVGQLMMKDSDLGVMHLLLLLLLVLKFRHAIENRSGGSIGSLCQESQ
jgi:hypothetical protein